jgi:Vacuolar protein sorting protein 36 Vps36
MQFARPIPLDPISGQPATALPEELQYKLQDGVDTYDGAAKVRRGDVLAVTSHRIYLVDGSRASPIQWSLAQVVNVATEEGGLFVGSPKIVLTLRPLPAPRPSSTAAPPAETNAVIKLSFKNGGRV